MAPAPPDLEILPLTPERIENLARLFVRVSWARYCWCAYFRVHATEFSTGTVASHRSVVERAVATTAAQGRAPGLVAYQAGEAVGWVSFGPRDDFPRLQRSRALGPIDDQPVWSIVCFVVAPQARRQGVARALLDAAIRYARDHGARMLEAYPAETSDRPIEDGDAYKGTVSMFERVGFEVVARRRHSRVTPERPIVRRALGPPR